MKCFRCEKEQGDEQGTYFRAEGNYGSTVFDPMDGTYLDIVLCDDCLRGHASLAECGRATKPVVVMMLARDGDFTPLVVGRARTPDRKPVPFNPDVMGDWDDDDKLVVELEEVGSDMPTVEWSPTAVKHCQYLLSKEEQQ